MLGIRLEPELESRLERLAKETGRSKSYYAKLAIRQFLEDREDYLLGIAALERKEPRISLEDLERGLARRSAGLQSGGPRDGFRIDTRLIVMHPSCWCNCDTLEGRENHREH